MERNNRPDCKPDSFFQIPFPGLFFLLLLVGGCASGVESTNPVQPAAPTIAPAVLPTSAPVLDVSRSEFTTAPQEIWRVQMDGPSRGPVQFAAGHVLAATDTTVYGFDPATGEEEWRYQPEGKVWSASLSGDGETAVVGYTGHIAMLDGRDGRERWILPVQGELLWPPVVTAEVVYAGTAFVGPGLPPDPEGKAVLYAIDHASGQPLWSQETDTYSLTTPAVWEDTIYAGGSFIGREDIEEGGHLRIHAFQAGDGAPIWQFESQDGFLKSLAADDNHVYFLAYTDLLYALDKESGVESWRYPTENWSPGFTLEAGIIYMGSDNAFVHAVDGVTGTAVWRVHLEGVFNAPRAEPALSDTQLYVHNNDNRLVAINKGNGTVSWQSAPQPRSRIPLAIGPDNLYLLSVEGEIIAYSG